VLKIIREHQRLTPTYERLHKVDGLVLNACPFLKRYCWNIAIAATKPAE
jgi:hypothetical protein